jgi:hypothetical protein
MNYALGMSESLDITKARKAWCGGVNEPHFAKSLHLGGLEDFFELLRYLKEPKERICCQHLIAP